MHREILLSCGSVSYKNVAADMGDLDRISTLLERLEHFGVTMEVDDAEEYEKMKF